MVLLDNEIYKETVKLVLGRKKPSPIVTELADWFFRTYFVTMLNFEFSSLKHFKEDRYRLFIILKDNIDYAKMHKNTFQPNPDYQKQIFTQFFFLSKRYNYADASFCQIY